MVFKSKQRKNTENKMAVANYTIDQVDSIVSQYTDGVDVADIADSVGKTPRSVIAKLSREGVYVAKVKKVATGAKLTKQSIVDGINLTIGMHLNTLVKASKDDLELLALALRS
jgi:hypothetical protein